MDHWISRLSNGKDEEEITNHNNQNKPKQKRLPQARLGEAKSLIYSSNSKMDTMDSDRKTQHVILDTKLILKMGVMRTSCCRGSKLSRNHRTLMTHLTHPTTQQRNISPRDSIVLTSRSLRVRKSQVIKNLPPLWNQIILYHLHLRLIQNSHRTKRTYESIA